MDYADIIAAIDAAILNWASQPVEIDVNGRKTIYRSLDELTRARKYYAQLLAQGADGNVPQFVQVSNGGPQG